MYWNPYKNIEKTAQNEITEFEAVMDEEEGFAGMQEVGDRLRNVRPEWDEAKVRRFGKWFLEEGIKEGWLFDEYGF